MPTYDYQCKTCGHRFEYFQSITSDALEHCPKDLCALDDESKKGTGDVV
ncbi:MAG: zinc ribbon domain-containing protein, partial [Candidatus Kapaibacterium sp.]